ncbi:tetratricopeptide repeat protein [Gulosibacter molinativorax]|uniref:Tetratricopeptide repeat protein n=1 Tax=Gulosibacter molinativorax TaxID=256821 RepID=A0ABT7C4I3_9MICO|nr:tetratricopeptide repeat protein [Gulosibacter molinativorax]MDJ1370115.1 tetratricopeptide repeat protein [Gulosibacter molinativorax]
MNIQALQQIQGYLNAGRHDRALDIARAGLARDPTSARRHLAVALAELGLEHFPEAERHAGIATSDPEVAPTAWHTIGTALRSIPGRKQDAIGAAATAVRLNPNEWTYRAGLAATLSDADRKQEALGEAHAAVQLAANADDWAQAMMILAYHQAAFHQRKQGLETAAAALSHDPTNISLQQGYLKVQALAGRHAQGLSTALAVLRASPTDREPTTFASIALYTVGFRIVMLLLVLSFLVGIIAIAIPSVLLESGTSGSSSWDTEVPPLLHWSIRFGGLAGLAGMALILYWQLRPAREITVRHALWTFARKSFVSWVLIVGAGLIALCYLAALALGPLSFFAVMLPLPLAIGMWWIHGTAGWMLPRYGS